MQDRFIPTPDGHWVEEKFHHLAEIINDYDPNFELVWIPPDQRSNPQDEECAFAIVDNHLSYKRYIVRYINPKTDDPAKVLSDLFEHDTRRHSPQAIINKIDLQNAASKLLAKKKQEEDMAEKIDMMAFLAKTRKNYLNLGRGIKLDSNLRRME